MSKNTPTLLKQIAEHKSEFRSIYDKIKISQKGKPLEPVSEVERMKDDLIQYSKLNSELEEQVESLQQELQDTRNQATNLGI